MRHFALDGVEPFPPRYNIAPTQPILLIEDAGEWRAKGSNLPDRRAALARWGLIPSWVKDVKAFPLLISARAESVAEKASFRAALRHRRVQVQGLGVGQAGQQAEHGQQHPESAAGRQARQFLGQQFKPKRVR